MFEKSIVLTATFLLIVFFIGYLGIKYKNPLKETLTNLDQNKLDLFEKRLHKMEKQIKINTEGVNDYLQNKKEFQKAMSA